MPTGLTQNSGYQVGARKTIDVPPEKAWDYLLSPMGLNSWLGTVAGELQEHEPFETKEGGKGLITIFKPGSHLRMKWQPPDWNHDSLLQLRMIPNMGRTTISFHQERMLDKAQRDEMKVHWNEVLERIRADLED